MYVQPSTSFEAVADGFTTGLTGTIGVRVIDNVGGTTIARVTAGITEVGTFGIYQKTLTAPSTAGQYTILWDDGSGGSATEDLVVTASSQAALTGHLYVTSDELKAAFNITNTDYADDDVAMACTSASRAIDLATKRFFYSLDGTRYYTPERNARSIEIDDVVTLTTFEVDLGGSGTFTTWTDGTDFSLDPINAPTEDKPYERVHLRTQRQTYWPYWTNSIKITGTFGWSEIPSEVRQYAKFLAGKLLYRTRHAPFGIVTVSGDVGAVARLTRTDPDFDTLIGHLVRDRPFV